MAQRLFALGSNGDLACLETASGKIVWKKNLRDDFGGQFGKWAYAESPLVDGDAVVCTPGGADATLVKLNKATGEVVWKGAVPEGGDNAGYASIIIVEAGGVKQYVQFLEKGLVGVDAKTGKFLWRYDKTAQGSPANIPTPVAKDALRLQRQQPRRRRSGAAQGRHQRLRRRAGLCHAAAALGDRRRGARRRQSLRHQLAGPDLRRLRHRRREVAGPRHRRGVAARGRRPAVPAWRERRRGPGRADARRLSREGQVHAAGHQPRDRGSSKAWAYPVVANGKLYIRDLGVVWCYDVSAK